MARHPLSPPPGCPAAGGPGARARRSGGAPAPPGLGGRRGAGPVAAARPAATPPAGTVRAAAPNPLTGLRLHHLVVIDPGHGGVDPGNPGRYFPDALVEKDITLAVARLLRAELMRRAIAVQLTRSTDTLIDLADRGAFCKAECDLFVSIHVNAMPAGRSADRVSGAETYFLFDAKTEDQERVAKMENEVIRFETGAPSGATRPLCLILLDLQRNG